MRATTWWCVWHEHSRIKCRVHSVRIRTVREYRACTICIHVYWLLASIFSQSEMSEALTEICRVDPTFDAVQFLRVVQYDIIPNIFEVSYKLGTFAQRS